MTAAFTQTAANGAMLTGKLLLARPGKIRFQYDKAPLLVVADGKRLSVVDYEVAQVSQWPIKSTPLGVLLDGDADLASIAACQRRRSTTACWSRRATRSTPNMARSRWTSSATPPRPAGWR